MEGSSQAVSTATPQASAMPTASGAPSVAAPAMSAPSTYQASPQMPVQAPSQPATYQPQAAPQYSGQTPTSNPWASAFQALSGSLNTPAQSLDQAQYSAYQTPTPQAAIQANWGYQAPVQQYSSVQAQPTYAAQASTQVFTEPEVQELLQTHGRNVAAEVAAKSGTDTYLSNISDTSLEVLEHFGAEAPALLNSYACAVEDALIEQVGISQHQHLVLGAAGEERQAMNLMLTNPDVLADYVNDFFGPNGPYPVETDAEAAQRSEAEYMARLQEDMYNREVDYAVPQNFRRPEMAMPTPGRRESEATSFWGNFSDIMDNNPEDAWRFLSQAPGQAFQSKMLVQES